MSFLEAGPHHGEWPGAEKNLQWSRGVSHRRLNRGAHPVAVEAHPGAVEVHPLAVEAHKGALEPKRFTLEPWRVTLEQRGSP